MRPPPSGADAQVRPDGVTLQSRVAVNLPVLVTIWVATPAFIIIPLSLPVGEELFGSWVPLVALGSTIIGVGLPTLFMLIPRRWRFELNEHWVEVEQTGLMRPKRIRIPLHSLQRWEVVDPIQDYAGHSLLLRTKDSTRRVMEGLPREQLLWLAEALDEAMEIRERRQAKEGREWSFMRKVPEEMNALIDRD